MQSLLFELPGQSGVEQAFMPALKHSEPIGLWPLIRDHPRESGKSSANLAVPRAPL